jgi:hypothetical protein
MADDDRRPDVHGRDPRATAAGPEPAPGPSEPRPNWLRRIIGQGPEARKRMGEAVAALLGTALVALAAIGGLVIWHLVRRGRIIRERLDPPRIVRMPERPDLTGELRDEDGELPTP